MLEFHSGEELSRILSFNLENGRIVITRRLSRGKALSSSITPGSSMLPICDGKKTCSGWRCTSLGSTGNRRTDVRLLEPSKYAYGGRE